MLLLAGDLTRIGYAERGRGARRRARRHAACRSSPCSATTTTTHGPGTRSRQILEAVRRRSARGRRRPSSRSAAHGSASPASRASAAASPAPAAATFGEPVMKEFVRVHARRRRPARAAPSARSRTPTCASPCSTTRRSRTTLVGERLEIYPFLGSYLLAEAIDCAGADLVAARPRPPRHREGRHAGRHPRAQRRPAADPARLQPLLLRRGPRRPGAVGAGRGSLRVKQGAAAPAGRSRP